MRKLITEMNSISKPAPNKRSYSVAEIQKILAVSRPTTYKLIKQNMFQSIRIGGSIRIIKASFDGWLDASM